LRDVTLSFRDTHGQHGRVTDSLDVEYSGDWREDVEECVRDVAEDVTTDHGSGRGDDPFNRLILELPEEAPIVEVVQTDPR
jgi:hypothetical protein